jgi:hypothetical protein
MRQFVPSQNTGTVLEPPPATTAPIPAVKAALELFTAIRMPAIADDAVGNDATATGVKVALVN